MTAKVLQVLILGLQIYFKEFANLQMKSVNNGKRDGTSFFSIFPYPATIGNQSLLSTSIHFAHP
jgi:hypothetical protein